MRLCLDAVAQFEHELLIRCDILPRSTEISRTDLSTMPIFSAVMFKKFGHSEIEILHQKIEIIM
jgi:hypothetical protein